MYAEEIIQGIDGPKFKEQRSILLGLYRSGIDTGLFEEEESEALDGLIHLLDQIADCAHDVYGKDCLLTGSKLERKAEENEYEQRVQQYNH